MARDKYDLPLVVIKWDDAETTHGWETDEEVDFELPTVTTVGFLVKETHNMYVIASTIGGGNNNARIKIPKGMCVSKKFLYQPKVTNKEVVEELIKTQ